ncbi:MBL fold metallo-hydrolase [Profundibacterium mesophilum]|nr:MBL fold metallo-hydrolase [Profundibacterium mesophilum]
MPWAEPPAFGRPLRVAEAIHWVRLPLPMALDHVNAYILEDEEGLTLVDPGLCDPATRSIWTALLDGPFAGRRVRRVIVTHHHPDHVGLAGWFVSDHGAELMMSRTAWLLARMMILDVQERPARETVRHWRRGGMAPDILERRRNERPFNFADVSAPLPLGFTRLGEGDTLTAAGQQWQVRMGAGHAPAHVTLWSSDAPLVIGGDQLLASISPNLGLYATEPEADPVEDWITACTRLLDCARDDQLVLPGHKLPFTGLPYRLRNLIDNHHAALGRLTDFLATAHSAAECFDLLYRRPIRGGEYGLALVEAMAHCQHLHHRGIAWRRERADGAWIFGTGPAPQGSPGPSG